MVVVHGHRHGIAAIIWRIAASPLLYLQSEGPFHLLAGKPGVICLQIPAGSFFAAAPLISMVGCSRKDIVTGMLPGQRGAATRIGSILESNVSRGAPALRQ